MTTQLWMWEYEQKTWIGYKFNRDWMGLNVNSEQAETSVICKVYEDQIYNLRPAKVVDADAVVIDKAQLNILRLAVKEGIEGIDSWRTKTYPQPDESVKARGALAAISQIVNGFSIPLTPPVTKTYLTTEQFIKVFKSLSDEKLRELGKAYSATWDGAWSVAWRAAWDATRDATRRATRRAAWDGAWSVAWRAAWDATRDATRSADLAILAKDAITKEHFNILTSPWTSCGLSLYAEDWDEVLSPKVTEPTGFGAIVEASHRGMPKSGTKWVRVKVQGYRDDWWGDGDIGSACWSDLINPVVISEGVSNGLR